MTCDHPALHEISPTELGIAQKTLAKLGEHPYLWAIVTGTHQYGFVSTDGDIDVRGAYVSPIADHVGLVEPTRHVEMMDVIDGREVDGVGFEIERFFRLVLKGSGNVIEELYSPIVLLDSGCLGDVRAAVSVCLSKQLVRHYLGFFSACIKKIEKKPPGEYKNALYAARIALTGILLFDEGRVEAHLPTLNQQHGYEFIPKWTEAKVTEHEPIREDERDRVFEHLGLLKRELKRAARRSRLPARPQGVQELSDLLVRIRMESLAD